MNINTEFSVLTDRPRRESTELIVVHCSATDTRDLGVEDVDRIHRNKGWQGCGYHFVIRRDGVVEAGEGLFNHGAHALGFNHNSVSVCMIGGVDAAGTPENNFTNSQFVALGATLEYLDCTFPDTKIVGHRDLYGDTNGDGVVDSQDWMKDCPSFDVESVTGSM